MRIGFDMRMAGTGEGIGRYTEELVKALAEIDNENDYVLLFDSESKSFKEYKIRNPRFKKAGVRSKYYSWAEQTRLISELNKMRLDVVHFPSFNAPIFYYGKFITTIHDVIHHEYPGKKKARFFHRLAYRFAISSAVRKSARVIAVSQSTAKAIAETFRVPEEKIEVIPEGIGSQFYDPVEASMITAVREKFAITKPYVLFVGVWRQYKNLPRLAKAFDILKHQGFDYQLVLAGKVDPYYPEIKEKVFSISHSSDIKTTGFVSDAELRALYQSAQIFAIPSLIEGFGLIGVEAQASRIPVAASDIPVLREILGEGAVYFDPYSEQNMAESFKALIENKSSKEELVRKGFANTARYDWSKTALKTLNVYRKVLLKS